MQARGFTLLEMIVVLALLGLATALVAPSMLRGIDSWRRQAALDALLDQVRALPGNARASGEPVVVDDKTLAAAPPPLRIDEDWTLTAPVPLTVGANGVCSDGELRVGNRYGERRLKVTAPFCDPELLP